MIKEIKLNGVVIPHVRDIKVDIETPVDEVTGVYREKTVACTVTITRDASDFGITELFDFATNLDGRKKIHTSAMIEMETDDKETQYYFELKKYFISDWELNNPSDPSQATTETVVIRAGEMTYNGGSAPADFALRDFN